MAEAVGLAASLASLLEISGAIVTAGYGYLSKVANAPTRMRMVLTEVSSVNLVLGRLEECSSAHQSASSSASILDMLSRNGVFEECKYVLKKIDGTIQMCMAESEAHSSKREVKAFMKRVIWPMKEKETDEVLEHLDRFRSILSNAIAQDSAASLRRLEETTQQLQKTSIQTADAQRYAELMKWVCPYDVNPFENFQAAMERRQPGTGTWLTDYEHFKTWSQHDHGLFWLRGLPGCGKTVLTSTVVEHIQCSLASKDNGTALAYSYIDYRNPAKQDLDACLATLVKQLVSQNPEGMLQLERLKQQKQRGLSQNLTTSEYISILIDLADLQKKVYVVIDALDEAPNPGAFVDVLKQLSDRNDRTPIAVFVSSRNDTNLENLLMPFVTYHVLVSNENNDDVRLFIATEVNKRFASGKLKVPDVGLIDLTISKLVARADGLFLQAFLLLKFVFAGNTSRSIRKALTELPNGLGSIYENVLRRTTSQNPRHVNQIKRSLQWLSMSFLPLTPKELVEAAAIDPDDAFLDPEAWMDENDLIGMLSSLVLVDWTHTPPVVGLAHQTVLEYLQSQSILQSDMSQYHIDTRTTHQYLAETSIQYLLFPESAKGLMQAARFRPPQTVLQTSYHDPFVTAARLAFDSDFAVESSDYQTLQRSTSLQQHAETHCSSSALEATTEIGPCVTHVPQEQALLSYVANLWPEHLKSGKYATHEFKESMVPRLQWYLAPGQESGSLYEVWEGFQRRRLSSSLYLVGPFRASDQQPLFRQLLKSSYFNYIGHKTTQNPFFYTILFGLDDCFNLLETLYDVNMNFQGGWTPLTVAAASGSLSTAKRLIKAGADVNKAADMNERNGLTPLHIAAELAMEDLVELFLSHGASVTSLTATMTTPFFRATRAGSANILKLLYNAGSDVNASTWDNYTPIMEIVGWLNHESLELVLSWGADPYYRNDHGESAIDKALEYGDEGAAEILRKASSRYTAKAMDPRPERYRAERRREIPPSVRTAKEDTLVDHDSEVGDYTMTPCAGLKLSRPSKRDLELLPARSLVAMNRIDPLLDNLPHSAVER